METKPEDDNQEPAAAPETSEAPPTKKSKTGNGSLQPKEKKAFYEAIVGKKKNKPI
jgi:hypothetical protein